MSSPAAGVIEAQLTSLDDTDCYASVWSEILVSQETGAVDSKNTWGGRGKGGRGLARRTVQPKDVVVDSVRLQYLQGDAFLEGATLKLLQQRVYALIGKNGCGKSTLLQRMHAKKIPGWSIQWTTLYLPAELPEKYLSKYPMDVILDFHGELHSNSVTVTENRIAELEKQLDSLDAEQEQEQIEKLCEELSELEEQLHFDQSTVEQQARQALHTFGLDIPELEARTCEELSRGQQKYVLLGVAMVCSFSNLLLLDEPTNALDVHGLIQLRRLVEEATATVVMVSHDVDLINDVATDIIEMGGQTLRYYPGNYDSYRLMKDQQGVHELRQSIAMEKKKGQLISTLQHLKEQPVPRRGGAKKKAKAIASHRKKLEWHETSEKASNSNATSTSPPKRGLTAAQRLKLAETMKSVPDKAIQFTLRPTPSVWGEPLITALEVGHGFDTETMSKSSSQSAPLLVDENDGKMTIVKRDGFLFDYIDLCIEEGSRNCILGPAASGKSTLLKLLAKRLEPVEGEVHLAPGAQVAYFDSQVMEDIVAGTSQTTTALDYCSKLHPQKSDQELRGHLTAFGLCPTSQAKTPVCFLSGGEKTRFVLATLMMSNPPILFLDDPTCHLDVESVQALIYGLQRWNGTLVMISHDASFVRSLENVQCMVLLPEEGKLRRINGSIDVYLKSFHA